MGLRGFGNNVSQLVELTGPKPLDTPEKFLGQLSWNAQSSHVACRDDEYEIPGTLFGLIKHGDGNDDTNFYATDKAVAWASGSTGLTKDLQDISRQYELGTADAYNYVVNTYMPLYSRDGLCTRTDGYEVGYVRAYLHMFLDAAEIFQGNGCSQGSKADNSCVEEFIV